MNARLAPLLALFALALPAGAVELSADGSGQALVFPYYTVRSTGGDAWNTYFSVVNPTADTKALRVSFREGRNGRLVFSVNVYLGPNDAWTAALIPSGTAGDWPARLLSNDNSCTSPKTVQFAFPDFGRVDYTGSRDDGLGSGLDRTREGYAEVIEMATLSGLAALQVTPSNTTGVAPGCAAVQAAGYAPAATELHAPTGGLSGTSTLINVNSGMDIGMNAVALSNLADAPLFHPAGDTAADFDAPQVNPVANLVVGNTHYRLGFPRGVDAVSAVLMHSALANEFVLDANTASSSAWVLTFPTRRFYAAGTAPFAAANGCVSAPLSVFDREAVPVQGCFRDGCVDAARACYASSVVDWTGASLFGSSNDYVIAQSLPSSGRAWAALAGAGNVLRSGDSTAWDLSKGSWRTGQFELSGVPVIGFAARTFKNGTLQCANYAAAGTLAACQGNYGGSFEHGYERAIRQVQ